MSHRLFEEFHEIDIGRSIDAVFDKNEKRRRRKLKGTLAGAIEDPFSNSDTS